MGLLLYLGQLGQPNNESANGCEFNKDSHAGKKSKNYMGLFIMRMLSPSPIVMHQIDENAIGEMVFMWNHYKKGHSMIEKYTLTREI